MSLSFGVDTLMKVAIAYVVFSFIANIVGGIAIVAILATGGICG